jgi:hypothetical protein
MNIDQWPRRRSAFVDLPLVMMPVNSLLRITLDAMKKPCSLGQMPDLSLTRSELGDLIAYIESMR